MRLGDCDCVWLCEGDPVAEGDPEPESDGELVGVRVCVNEGVALVVWLAVAVRDAVPVALGDALDDFVAVWLCDGVPLALGVAESECDGLPLEVTAPERVAVALGVALPLGVPESEPEALPEGVADCEGVGEQTVFVPRRIAEPSDGAAAHTEVPGLRVHAPVTCPRPSAGAATGAATHERPFCVFFGGGRFAFVCVCGAVEVHPRPHAHTGSCSPMEYPCAGFELVSIVNESGSVTVTYAPVDEPTFTETTPKEMGLPGEPSLLAEYIEATRVAVTGADAEPSPIARVLRA